MFHYLITSALGTIFLIKIVSGLRAISELLMKQFYLSNIVFRYRIVFDTFIQILNKEEYNAKYIFSVYN